MHVWEMQRGYKGLGKGAANAAEFRLNTNVNLPELQVRCQQEVSDMAWFSI